MDQVMSQLEEQFLKHIDGRFDRLETQLERMNSVSERNTMSIVKLESEQRNDRKDFEEYRDKNESYNHDNSKKVIDVEKDIVRFKSIFWVMSGILVVVNILVKLFK